MEEDAPVGQQDPSAEVSEEHKLRRLLFLGTTKSSIHLKAGYNTTTPNDKIQASVGGINKAEINHVPNLISTNPPPGLMYIALQHVKESIRREKNDLHDRRAVFLVLSALLKIDNKMVKTSVYETLSKLIKNSPEDLFEFIYYHKKVFSKRPYGMGAGMRRLISGWYLDQDPYDLALEVSRVRSRHDWDHADLLKLCRFKGNSVGMEVIISHLVRGFKKIEHKFQNNDEAQPILELLNCVKQLNRTPANNVSQAVELIEKHSFDIESVQPNLRVHAQVWEHALVRTPLKVVLINLKSLNNYNLLSNEQDPVLKKVLNIFNDNHALINSKLKPLEILEYIATVEAGWDVPQPGIKHKDKITKRVPKHKPHPSLLSGMETMMRSSFINISPRPMSMFLHLDTSEWFGTLGKCFGSWNLSMTRALSVLILSLLQAGTDLNIIYSTGTNNNDTKFNKLVVTRDMSVEEVETKLSSVQGRSSVLDPAKMLRHIREKQGQTNIVVSVTGSYEKLDRHELWASMEQFKVEGNNLKYVYWAMNRKEMIPGVRNTSNHNMLDICGWSPDVMRIIQAFGTDCF